MSARRRVVVVGPLPPPVNGMTRMTEVVLLSSLAARYDLVHVDTSDHREQSSIGRLDLRNVLLGVWHGLTFVRALLRRPDLCYIPIARSRAAFLRDLLFLIPARLARRPRVVHFHSRDFAEFYSKEPAVLRWVIRRALGGDTHAVVLGESRRRDFGDLLPAERIHVVPNGVPDIGVGAGTRGPVVLHLTSLWREKGVFTVLAVANALKEVPGLRVVLAGEWMRETDRLEAESYIESHGLRDIVVSPGPVVGAEKVRLLRDASVMLFPSTYPYEGHPLVVLEALSAGTPVVASPLAAIPEILRDGQSGFLVAPEDVEFLAARVRALLEDESLRRRMGAAARRRYEEAFTDRHFATALGAVWDSVGSDATNLAASGDGMARGEEFAG